MKKNCENCLFKNSQATEEPCKSCFIVEVEEDFKIFSNWESSRLFNNLSSISDDFIKKVFIKEQGFCSDEMVLVTRKVINNLISKDSIDI